MQWNRNNDFRQGAGVPPYRCQKFRAEYLTAGQIPVEFEAANHLVDREVVHQACDAGIPWWWFLQATTTQIVCAHR
jgi:hypothetical protein